MVSDKALIRTFQRTVMLVLVAFKSEWVVKYLVTVSALRFAAMRLQAEEGEYGVVNLF